MNVKKPVFIALAIALAAPYVSAAEVGWPNNSVGDLSIFVTLQRFQIYADYCSTKVPQLKPKFASLMEELNSHIRDISTVLLSSDAFKDMRDEPVPPGIRFALKDSLDDAKHNFERQDAESICPEKLESLSQIDDESLKADLTQTLLAVQNMTQNLKREGAR
jgi:hypothetical protein